MSQIPNLITSVRLIAAALILLSCLSATDHGRTVFLPLFIVAGVSDMLDGFIARKYHWCTEFGAKLDSVSDLCLYISAATFLVINAPVEISRVQVLLIIGACIQVLHLAFAFYKHGRFPSYHTTYSRLCAYLIFFGVVFFCATGGSTIFPLLVIAWTTCSIEGIIITFILNGPACDLSGVGKALAINNRMRHGEKIN
jgi:phosphatidylglycerophosphate synthase